MARVHALVFVWAAALAAAHEHANDLSFVVPSAVTVALNADATLTLNASAVVDLDFVQVTISNPAHAAKGDWIAMYAASADPATTVPLKWTYIIPYVPGDYNTTGVASLPFQVYAIRDAVVFRLFSGGTKKPVLLAETSPLPFADVDAPHHPRVLPGGKPGVYTIVWTLGAGSGNTNPNVKWGVTPGLPLVSVAPATTRSINVSELCGAPATTIGWMDLGLTASSVVDFTAHVGSKIYYSLADDAHPSGGGNVYSFAVPPLPGTLATPFPFVAFGDLGRGSYDIAITWAEYGGDSRSTAALLGEDVKAGRVQFAHHFGDVSYAQGFGQTWDEYLAMIEPFAGGSVYVTGG